MINLTYIQVTFIYNRHNIILGINKTLFYIYIIFLYLTAEENKVGDCNAVNVHCIINIVK